ncbi:Crp/Fnr family transcriptional regulator [Marivirga arenosa]|uniref:Crp/Fnr family transcriptional regulator n=1 Tax=Marivirga arenosa TaxID=3059076 RepID=A0AA51R5P8_9BACT|nr:Crp/Fnr family transcriptional regulator [Marivirga sp. ABR2-2]WMN05917.1 Crp/Fnr family transcriptional regulator [Marivirga sp. ABR2-2]
MSKKVKNIPCELCLSRRKSMFNEIPEQALCTLSEHKSTLAHNKGQVLFLEGTQPMGLFCISEGKVKIYKTDDSGREQIVRLAKDGDFLGYRALLSGENYNSSATILENAKVCFIPKSSFTDLISKDQDFQNKLMQAVCHDLGVMEQKMADMANKTVRQRLATTLLMLKNSYGIDGDQKTEIDIALTREDLAKIVGTATETLIRLLSDFKKDGLIDINGKKISIVDAKGIAKEIDLFA